MKERILLSWSGGKDSCMTLYELQKSQEYEIDSLLTTITEDYDRISIHRCARRTAEAASTEFRDTHSKGTDSKGFDQRVV